MDDYVDSEADEEVRQALCWVLSGELDEMETPGIIQTALEEIAERDQKAEARNPK